MDFVSSLYETFSGQTLGRPNKKKLADGKKTPQKKSKLASLKSPQNAKRSNFFQDELYLNFETNFFSLLVFTGSQGSKKLAARAPPRRYFSDQTEKV